MFFRVEEIWSIVRRRKKLCHELRVLLRFSNQRGVKYIQFSQNKTLLHVYSVDTYNGKKCFVIRYHMYTKIKILCKENTTVICTMNASYNVGTATLMWDLREIEQKKFQQKNSACGLHGVDI